MDAIVKTCGVFAELQGVGFPSCGLWGNTLSLSSSCQHIILILLCLWLLLAIVLLPYIWLLMHYGLTLLSHLRGLQFVLCLASC